MNEDNALKQYCTGITVADDKNSTRPVRVWFNQPDIEITAQTYPYMTIEMVDIVMDAPRAMGGIMELPYVPEGSTAALTGQAHISEIPIPVILQYQVTTFARHPRHDREILYGMLQRFPWQHGGIEVPEDNTVRRAYLNRTINRDRTEDTKRLFSKAFDISVETELIRSRFLTVQQATSVNTTLTQVTINQDVNP